MKAELSVARAEWGREAPKHYLARLRPGRLRGWLINTEASHFLLH